MCGQQGHCKGGLGTVCYGLVVNFEKQALLIEEVLTHEEYDRENL